ncbi:MAG: rhomboid family intramembrane serine protease [Pseudomonadota bacterium]|nr:rhomboid family intramembrane serine protease [Pseudomonadota bacterium]
MFPIKDDNPQLQTPYVTYAIICLNLLAWFVLQGLGSHPVLGQSVCQFGLIPADLFNDFTYDTSQWPCPSDEGVGWTGFISSMFMHGGWMHLLGNLWFLWVFGDNVEDAMGHKRFALFYLLCGLAAAATQVVANTQSAIPMVGASGAIGGVMGAYIMLYPRVKVHMLFVMVVFITTIRVPAVLMLGYWAFVQFAGGVSSLGATGGGVAFWAHIGGFIAGAILVFAFKDQHLLSRHPYYGWREPRH